VILYNRLITIDRRRAPEERPLCADAGQKIKNVADTRTSMLRHVA
jgi:hypothetical protein